MATSYIKKRSYARSIYNGADIQTRFNIINEAGIPQSEVVLYDDGIINGVKGWTQISNENKKAIIDYLDSIGALD